MIPPQFDLSQEEKPALPRAGYGGWAALFFVLGILTLSQLIPYFSARENSESQFVEVSQQFRMGVLQREALRRIPQSQRILEGSDAAAAFENLVATVAEDRFKNATAARLYAAMRFEQKKEVKPEDLKILAESKKPEEKAFAEIYSRETMTLESAKALAREFPKNAFSYRMAELHALERAGDKEARNRFFPASEVAAFTVALAALLAAFFTGGFLLFVYFAMRMSGRWKPVGHPAGKLTAHEADAYAGKAAIMLLGFIALGVGISLAFSSVLSDEAVNVAAGIGTTLFALLLLSKWRSPDGPSMRLFAFEKRQLGSDVLWGIGGALANIPLFMCCNIASQWLFSGLPNPGHPISTQLESGPSFLTLLFLGIAAAVIAPIFEEICFRGTITPAMERLFGGPFPGIVAAALAFAMIHPQGIVLWMPLAMIGAMGAMLTYQRGSLVPAIVMHAVHNGSLLAITLMTT